MKRTVFSDEHELFRQSFQQFLTREVRPRQKAWIENGIVDRDVWRKAGEAGFLCPWLDEAHGGPGGDFLHSVVVMEELARAYESGFALPLHNDVVVPYIAHFGSDAVKARWLPRCASGEAVTAIAMTEPGTGSDLASIRTTARRDGDDYVLNGAKTFITNGILCDVCIVAAKTGGPDDPPHQSISLFLVEADRPGFQKTRKLEKIGLHAQDTAELAFEDCRVPAENLLGQEGMGFFMLMQELAQERLVVAVGAQAAAAQVVDDTIRYCKEREAFGRPISKFQHLQFELVDCATEVEVGWAFLDKLIAAHVAGEDLVTECSMAKSWFTEMQGRVVDRCLQLHGGYGYMMEYPVARAFVDARVQRIYAGTNEIMRTIVAKRLGL